MSLPSEGPALSATALLGRVLCQGSVSPCTDSKVLTKLLLPMAGCRIVTAGQGTSCSTVLPRSLLPEGNLHVGALLTGEESWGLRARRGREAARLRQMRRLGRGC